VGAGAAECTSLPASARWIPSPSLFAKVEFSTANRPGRLELSEAMMQSLGAFARTGDPNTPTLGVTWPLWPAMLKFDATPTHKIISVE
jgi:para-nitrobenzyl esterase